MAAQYDEKTVAELTGMVKDNCSVWGLGPRAQVKLLNLSENATFLGRDQDAGRDIIIRVQRTGYSSKDAIRSELSWIKALHDSGTILTAQPVQCVDGSFVAQMSTASGQQRMAVAFERLGGAEPKVGQDGLAYWFEKIGGLTAKMHAQARSWKRPGWFTRRVWDWDGIIGEHAFWGRWQDSIGLTKAGHDAIARVLAIIKPILDRYGTSPDRFGVIHADMRATNLLIDGDKLQVIDFDDMGFGWYLFDCGASLSFMEQDPSAPSLLAAWIKGYESVAPLGAYEKSLLPVFSILRRIELTAWCASHFEIPFCQENAATITRDTEKLAQDFIDGVYLRDEAYEARAAG
ncbi:MAG: phosphotransferase enzyme family protein [Succinivibrio sp.]